MPKQISDITSSVTTLSGDEIAAVDDPNDLDANGNPITKQFSLSQVASLSPAPDLSAYAKLDDDAQTIIAEQFKATGDVAITYDGDFVETVTIGTRVITFTNDGSTYTSWADSVNTWTPTYTDGQLTGVAVT